jgi:hypothetical protein
MKTSPEDKATLLIALATSTTTPPEEARTAAFQACVLIASSGLRLGVVGGSSSTDKEFWSRVVENIVTATDCKEADTAMRWADKLLEARKKRFG